MSTESNQGVLRASTRSLVLQGLQFLFKKLEHDQGVAEKEEKTYGDKSHIHRLANKKGAKTLLILNEV